METGQFFPKLTKSDKFVEDFQCQNLSRKNNQNILFLFDKVHLKLYFRFYSWIKKMVWLKFVKFDQEIREKFASCTLHHAHHVFCNQCDKINNFWEIYTCKNYLSWSKKLFFHSNEGIFYIEKLFKHAYVIRYVQ